MITPISTRTLAPKITWALGCLMMLAGTAGSAWAAPDRYRPTHVRVNRAPVRHVRVYRPSRRTSPPPVRVRRRARRRTVVVHAPPPQRTVVVRKKAPPRAKSPEDGKLMVLVGAEFGTSHHDSTRAPNFVTGLRLAAVVPSGGALAKAWAGAYGRVNVQPEADITRSAMGLTAGFMMFNAELGLVSESFDGGPGFLGSDRTGTELLLGIGLFEYVGLYSRVTSFEYGGGVNEYGIRMNMAL